VNRRPDTRLPFPTVCRHQASAGHPGENAGYQLENVWRRSLPGPPSGLPIPSSWTIPIHDIGTGHRSPSGRASWVSPSLPSYPLATIPAALDRENRTTGVTYGLAAKRAIP
jgi:hypothetical protein